MHSGCRSLPSQPRRLRRAPAERLSSSDKSTNAQSQHDAPGPERAFNDIVYSECHCAVLRWVRSSFSSGKGGIVARDSTIPSFFRLPVGESIEPGNGLGGNLRADEDTRCFWRFSTESSSSHGRSRSVRPTARPHSARGRTGHGAARKRPESEVLSNGAWPQVKHVTNDLREPFVGDALLPNVRAQTVVGRASPTA